MLTHCGSDGRCRFSGLAFQSAARSASRSSARPRRVSFCLRVSHPRATGRGSRGSAASTSARVVLGVGVGLRVVGRRDQPELGVEDADQVVELAGAVRQPEASRSSASDRCCPLMSVPPRAAGPSARPGRLLVQAVLGGAVAG